MDTQFHSIRLALRRLRRNKMYSGVIILCLAFGIGANTAIFSVVNTLLFQPLPIKDVDRVVFTLDMRNGDDPFEASLLDAIAYKTQAQSFSDVGLGRYQVFRLLGGDRPERLSGALITHDYLTTLGITPHVGRLFLPEDDRPGAPAVALISHSLWKLMFGSDPGILGQKLRLGEQSHTVVGVLQEGFDLPLGTQVWIPLALNMESASLDQQARHEYFLVSRLKEGVSLESANSEVDVIARQLEQTYPEKRRGWGLELIPLRQQLLGDITGSIRPTLFLLMGIVGFLLLIACGNVASLLLVRAVQRTHETAIYTALGASRRRLIDYLLTESVLLSLIGGVVGLLFSRLVTASLMTLNPVYFFALKDTFQSVSIDGRVLAFAFFVSLLTGVLFAVAPAIRTALPGSLALYLKEGGQRTGGGLGGRRLFDLLMVCEIAVAMILLVGTGLLVRSFQRLSDVNLGFKPDHLLTMEMYLPESDYPQQVQRVEFVRQVLDRVGHLQGATSAGASTNIPLTLSSEDSTYIVEGKPPLDASEISMTSHRMVSPGYLETMGVSLLQGRLIEEQDRPDTLPIVVVSREFARRAWPNEDAIGKRVTAGRVVTANSRWHTVVGVVEDVKEDRYNFRVNRPVWYVPYVQSDTSLPVMLVVRATMDPASLVTAVREAIASVNKNQALSDIKTMDARVDDFLGPQRFTALLSTLFAGLGLFLAAVGIYGVTAYSVMQRTREFCIRLALGAGRGDLVRLVVGRGLRLVLVGLTIGAAGGLALGQILANLLYEVKTASLETLVLPGVLLLAVAVMAMYLPLNRLKKINPVSGTPQ